MFSLQFARRLMAAGLAVLLWGAAAAAAHAAADA